MKIETKKLDKNLLEITAEISILEMAPYSDKAIEELGKDIEISGFRKGKAPKDMVKNQIDEIKILQTAGEIAVNEIYLKTIEKEKIEPIGQPDIQVQKLAPNNPFSFKLTVPLMPKIKLNDYKKIKVKKDKVEVKKDKIDKMLKELQKARRKETIVNRKSKIGDRVDVDLNLFNNKVPVENGQIKDMAIVLGEDTYLPGLDNKLKNLKPGEQTKFSFKYPKSHYDKNLAGKIIDFEVKVKNVYEIELPEINDEFAQTLGGFKTVNDLKNKIKENLELEEKNKQEQKFEIQMLKKLIEQTEFEEIPETLIDYEIRKMINELKMSIESHEHTHGMQARFEDYLKSIKKTEEDLRKEFIPKAKERIKTALCIRQIAQNENIQSNEQEIKQEMEKLSELYKDNDRILKDLKSENGQIYLQNLLINKKTIEYLKKILTG